MSSTNPVSKGSNRRGRAPSLDHFELLGGKVVETESRKPVVEELENEEETFTASKELENLFEHRRKMAELREQGVTVHPDLLAGIAPNTGNLQQMLQINTTDESQNIEEKLPEQGGDGDTSKGIEPMVNVLEKRLAHRRTLSTLQRAGIIKADDFGLTGMTGVARESINFGKNKKEVERLMVHRRRLTELERMGIRADPKLAGSLQPAAFALNNFFKKKPLKDAAPQKEKFLFHQADSSLQPKAWELNELLSHRRTRSNLEKDGIYISPEKQLKIEELQTKGVIKPHADGILIVSSAMDSNTSSKENSRSNSISESGRMRPSNFQSQRKVLQELLEIRQTFATLAELGIVKLPKVSPALQPTLMKLEKKFSHRKTVSKLSELGIIPKEKKKAEDDKISKLDLPANKVEISQELAAHRAKLDELNRQGVVKTVSTGVLVVSRQPSPDPMPPAFLGVLSPRTQFKNFKSGKMDLTDKEAAELERSTLPKDTNLLGSRLHSRTGTWDNYGALYAANTDERESEKHVDFVLSAQWRLNNLENDKLIKQTPVGTLVLEDTKTADEEEDDPRHSLIELYRFRKSLQIMGVLGICDPPPPIDDEELTEALDDLQELGDAGIVEGNLLETVEAQLEIHEDLLESLVEQRRIRAVPAGLLILFPDLIDFTKSGIVARYIQGAIELPNLDVEEKRTISKEMEVAFVIREMGYEVDLDGTVKQSHLIPEFTVYYERTKKMEALSTFGIVKFHKAPKKDMRTKLEREAEFKRSIQQKIQLNALQRKGLVKHTDEGVLILENPQDPSEKKSGLETKSMSRNYAQLLAKQLAPKIGQMSKKQATKELEYYRRTITILQNLNILPEPSEINGGDGAETPDELDSLESNVKMELQKHRRTLADLVKSMVITATDKGFLVLETSIKNAQKGDASAESAINKMQKHQRTVSMLERQGLVRMSSQGVLFPAQPMMNEKSSTEDEGQRLDIENFLENLLKLDGRMSLPGGMNRLLRDRMNDVSTGSIVAKKMKKGVQDDSLFSLRGKDHPKFHKRRRSSLSTPYEFTLAQKALENNTDLLNIVALHCNQKEKEMEKAIRQERMKTLSNRLEKRLSLRLPRDKLEEKNILLADEANLDPGEHAAVKRKQFISKKKKLLQMVKLRQITSEDESDLNSFGPPKSAGKHSRSRSFVRGIAERKNEPLDEQDEARLVAMTSKTLNYIVGDRVQLTQNRRGIIKFIGEINIAEGEVIGVELDTWAIEGGDGSANGHQYFKCEPGQGLWIRAASIVARIPDKTEQTLHKNLSRRKYPKYVKGDRIKLTEDFNHAVGTIRFVGRNVDLPVGAILPEERVEWDLAHKLKKEEQGASMQGVGEPSEKTDDVQRPFVGSDGITYGIELAQWHMDGTDGSIPGTNKRYFTTKKGRGLFVGMEDIAIKLAGPQKKRKISRFTEDGEFKLVVDNLQNKAWKSTKNFEIGDRVKLAKGKSATIRYIGQTEFATGEFFGLELDERAPQGHDGTVSGKQYFKVEFGRGHFVRRKQILDFEEKDKSKHISEDLQIGSRVDIGGVKKGVVKFIGKTKVRGEEEMVGVELDESHETGHDGFVGGKKYFEAKKGHGCFIRRKSVVDVKVSDDGEKVFVFDESNESYTREPSLSNSDWSFDGKVSLQDRVKLKGGRNGEIRTGVVRYIGQVHFMKGDVVGLEMNKWSDRYNNAVVDGVKYFDCPEGRGFITSIENIIEVIDPTQFLDQKTDRLYTLEIGHKVELEGGKTGTVQYIGIPNFSKEELIGIVLDNWDPNGHDGSAYMIKYFHAEPNFGLFVKREDIVRLLTGDDHLNLLSVRVPSDEGDYGDFTSKATSEVSFGEIGRDNRTAYEEVLQSLAHGDRVRLERGRTGVVKFIGEVEFAKEEVIGIELDKWKAKGHCGTVRGVKYFQAAEGRGYFTRRENISEIIEKGVPDPNWVFMRIGDYVQLDDGTQGHVKYISDPDGKEEELVGLELDDPILNGHRGVVDGAKFFEAKRGHGTLVPRTKVSKVLKAVKLYGKKSASNESKADKEQSPLRVNNGDRVLLTSGKIGTVLFKGEVPFAEGEVLGLELDSKVETDGSSDRERYFDCKQGHGYFSRATSVVQILDPKEVDTMAEVFTFGYRIGDSVMLRSGASGTVRYSGENEHGDRIYGIELPNAVPGGTSGNLSTRKLFTCPEGRGIFVLADEVSGIKKDAWEPEEKVQNLIKYKVGDYVELTKGRKGHLAWIGDVEGTQTYGVKLDSWNPDASDGHYKGRELIPGASPGQILFKSRSALLNIIQTREDIEWESEKNKAAEMNQPRKHRKSSISAAKRLLKEDGSAVDAVDVQDDVFVMIPSDEGTQYLKIRTFFNFFDRRGESELHQDDLEHMMACAGANSDPKEIMEHFKPPVNFNDFHQAMRNFDPESLDSIMKNIEVYVQGKLTDAFEYFDEDNDKYLQWDDLDKINRATGQRLNMAQFDPPVDLAQFTGGVSPHIVRTILQYIDSIVHGELNALFKRYDFNNNGAYTNDGKVGVDDMYNFLDDCDLTIEKDMIREKINFPVIINNFSESLSKVGINCDDIRHIIIPRLKKNLEQNEIRSRLVQKRRSSQTWMVLSDPVMPNDANQIIQDIFHFFDADGDGAIGPDEFQHLKRVIGEEEINIFQPDMDHFRFYNDLQELPKEHFKSLTKVMQDYMREQVEAVFNFFSHPKTGEMLEHDLLNLVQRLQLSHHENSFKAVFCPPCGWEEFLEAWGLLEHDTTNEVLHQFADFRKYIVQEIFSFYDNADKKQFDSRLRLIPTLKSLGLRDLRKEFTGYITNTRWKQTWDRLDVIHNKDLKVLSTVMDEQIEMIQRIFSAFDKRRVGFLTIDDCCALADAVGDKFTKSENAIVYRPPVDVSRFKQIWSARGEEDIKHAFSVVCMMMEKELHQEESMELRDELPERVQRLLWNFVRLVGEHEQMVDLPQFVNALVFGGINMPRYQMESLFEHLGTDRTNRINYKQFLQRLATRDPGLLYSRDMLTQLHVPLEEPDSQERRHFRLEMPPQPVSMNFNDPPPPPPPIPVEHDLKPDKGLQANAPGRGRGRRGIDRDTMHRRKASLTWKFRQRLSMDQLEMRNILPSKKRKAFRIAWGALVSTHFDLDDPNRKVIGGIPSGLAVEALEIKDNRVKIKRPEAGWSKEKALNFLPGERFGWISVIAQDGTKLLEPIEDGEETNDNTPMLTLDKAQTKAVTKSHLNGFLRRRMSRDQIPAHIVGVTPVIPTHGRPTAGTQLGGDLPATTLQEVLAFDWDTIFTGDTFAKQVVQDLSGIDVMSRIHPQEKKLLRRMIGNLETTHKKYCKRVQDELLAKFYDYVKKLNRLVKRDETLHENAEQTRLHQERLEAKAMSLEKENQDVINHYEDRIRKIIQEFDENLKREKVTAEAILGEEKKKRDVAEKLLDERGKTYESVQEEVDLISSLKQGILDSGGDEAKIQKVLDNVVDLDDRMNLKHQSLVQERDYLKQALEDGERMRGNLVYQMNTMEEDFRNQKSKNEDLVEKLTRKNRQLENQNDESYQTLDAELRRERKMNEILSKKLEKISEQTHQTIQKVKAKYKQKLADQDLRIKVLQLSEDDSSSTRATRHPSMLTNSVANQEGDDNVLLSSMVPLQLQAASEEAVSQRRGATKHRRRASLVSAADWKRKYEELLVKQKKLKQQLKEQERQTQVLANDIYRNLVRSFPKVVLGDV